MRFTKLKTTVLLVLMSLMSGCNILKPSTPVVVDTYTLSTPDAAYHANVHSHKSLLVAIPTSSAEYNGTDMYYQARQFQLKAYRRSRWVAKPARLLQSNLVSQLEASGAFKAVVKAPIVAKTDLRLETHLMSLHQVLRAHGSQVNVVIDAQLLDNKTNAIIASERFKASYHSNESDAYAGVVTANQAMQKILPNLVKFCIMHL